MPTAPEGLNTVTSLSSITVQSELPTNIYTQSAMDQDIRSNHGEEEESKLSQEDDDIYGDPSPGDAQTAGAMDTIGGPDIETQGNEDVYGPKAGLDTDGQDDSNAMAKKQKQGSDSGDEENGDMYQRGNGDLTTKGEYQV